MGYKKTRKTIMLWFLFIALFGVVAILVAPFDILNYDKSVFARVLISRDYFSNSVVFYGNYFSDAVYNVFPAIYSARSIISIVCQALLYAFAGLTLIDIIVMIIFLCKKKKRKVKYFGLIAMIVSIIFAVILLALLVIVTIYAEKQAQTMTYLLNHGFIPIVSMILIFILKALFGGWLFKLKCKHIAKKTEEIKNPQTEE